MILARTSFSSFAFVLFILQKSSSFLFAKSTYIEPMPDLKTIGNDQDPQHVNGEKSFTLLMPGAKPIQEDFYVCTAMKINEDDLYVTQFEAVAEANTAHHMLLFGCGAPAEDAKMWECSTPCRDSRILYAWARNADPTRVPADVAFHIGKKSKVKHLVLQVHYARVFDESEDPDFSGVKLRVTEERPHYLAGMMLMGVGWLTIPGQTPVVHGDASCKFHGSASIFPFAYRTHAHTLGTVITGYQRNDTGWHLLGKGNPQWPQAFYPINGTYEVQPGDLVAARCTFNSTGRDRDTYIGATHNDEMCNFYMMFYTNANRGKTYYDCWGDEVSGHYTFPAGSDTRLPPNPLLDEMAKGHHHHHHHGSNEPEVYKTVLDVTVVKGWPKLWPELKLGQVSGVDTDTDGNVHIFHRATTIWDRSSFDLHENYLKVDEGPIKEKALISIDKDGQILQIRGDNMFYMPHGLTIDCQDNVWLTDVAMHQVFRFPNNSDTPDLTLGEKFVPGNDKKHFCKPTDVAVLKNGDFFVADGYCNTRIIKFDKNGIFIKQWGTNENNKKEKDNFPPPGSLNLPHSLALAEDNNTLCVADRENGRIQCFDLDGNFKFQIHPEEFGGPVYAVAYSSNYGGVLHAVTGPPKAKGFCLAMNSTGEILATFEPSKDGFELPHDIAVDSTGEHIYVAGIKQNRVWKFESTESRVIVKKEEIDHKPGISLDTEDTADNGDEIVDNGSIPAAVIGVALVVPVILIIVVTIIIRLKQSGKLSLWTVNRYDQRNGFSIGKLFNRHHGFDPLNTEELEHLTDSDGDEIEEFSSQRKL